MLGIIGAMEIETDGLIAKMSECKINELGGYKFVKGKLRGKDVAVCRCGIGKVFSSTAAALMISAYEIDGIINIGVAGGMKPLKQGELVIAERTVQHDFDSTADGLEKGCVPGFDSPYFNCDRALVGQLSEIISRLGYRYKVGTVASGDLFVGSKSKSEEISRQFGATLSIWKAPQSIRFASAWEWDLPRCVQFRTTGTTLRLKAFMNLRPRRRRNQ